MAKYKDSDLFWLNDMRFLAAIAVIFVHISQGVMKISDGIGSMQWWVANIYQALTYWGVPVFVMISGALLLNPSREYVNSKEFYNKRVKRLLPPLIFWSIVYILWSFLKAKVTHTSYGISDIVNQLIMGTPYYHLWYVYMVFGLYLITPYLRKVIKYSTKEELFVIVGLVMFLSIVSVYSNGGSIETVIFLQKFPYYIGYFVLGYLIMKYSYCVPTIVHVLFFMLSVLATIIGAAIVESPYMMYNNFSPTMIITAVSLMFIIKSLHKKIPIKKEIREKLASFSLGAYLIHPLILSVIKKFNYFDIDLKSYSFFAIPFFVFIIVVISILIAYIMSKIPYLRRTI